MKLSICTKLGINNAEISNRHHFSGLRFYVDVLSKKGRGGKWRPLTNALVVMATLRAILQSWNVQYFYFINFLSFVLNRIKRFPCSNI